MAEFEAITTQEEFEKRLLERLAQKEKSVKKQFEGYLSPQEVETLKADYDNQIKELNGKVSESDVKVKDYESKIANYESDSVKTRIATEMGIPLKFKDRLKGETEEELREDAKLFSGYSKLRAPLASTEDNGSSDEVYKDLLKDLDV